MNTVKAFKKWLLNNLGSFIEGTAKKKKGISQEQRYRDLFKKRKSALIIGAVLTCLIVFGIGKIFSFIAVLLASSPFVVIFWNSFGEQLMGIFKFKKYKK